MEKKRERIWERERDRKKDRERQQKVERELGCPPPTLVTCSAIW